MLISVAYTARAATDDAAPPRYDVARSRWHLLFPLDAAEWAPESKRNEATGKTDRRRVKRIFTQDLIDQIESNYRKVEEIESRSGMPPRPRPWSYMHWIEDDVVGAELPDGAILERSGSLFDIHVERAGGERPPGLWGLIEWTPRALGEFADGTWMELSPTTHSRVVCTDGTVLNDGLYLVGGALVNWGALDSIGTARDGVAADTFTTATRVASRLQRHGYGRRIAAGKSGSVQDGLVAVIQRALTLDETETEQENEMTPEQLEELKNAVGDAVAAALNAWSDSAKAIVADACSRAVAAPVVTETKREEEIPAMPDAEAAEVEIDQAARKATVDAYRSAGQAAIDEVKRLVTERKLRPADVGSFVSRRAHFDPAADELVRDYTNATAPTGVPGSDGADRTPAVTARSVSAKDFAAELTSEWQKDRSRNILAVEQTLRSAKAAQGITIIETEEG